ncbi:MAG: hypothetical protein U9N36_10720 [Euryarchaeota archaeon]|nr:hypothetical protein [Euryarchaeota archaeon]
MPEGAEYSVEDATKCIMHNCFNVLNQVVSITNYMLKSAICKGIHDYLYAGFDFIRNQSIFEFYNRVKHYNEDRELELRRCPGLVQHLRLVDRTVVLTPRSRLAGAFCYVQDFSGKRDGISVDVREVIVAG